jgi:hypothetical protein
MTPDDREMMRDNILLQCHSASRKGKRFSAIVAKLKYDNFSVTDGDVDGEIRYLEGKGWIAETKKEMSPELRRYVITSAGTDHLATEGLI